MNEKIKEKYFGTKKDFKKFKEAIKELRYEVSNENTEVQDMVNFVEDLMDKFKDNFDKAIQEATDKERKRNVGLIKKIKSDYHIYPCDCEICKYQLKVIKEIEKQIGEGK